jgi:tyrosinase
MMSKQILGWHVQTIAKQYSSNDQPAYQAAANSFRIPYWDWATDNALPQAVVTPNTTVRGPNGATISMTNPLYSYRWQTNPPQGTGFGGKLAQWPETKRYPDPSGVNNESQASMQLSRDDLKSPVVSSHCENNRRTVQSDSPLV